MKIKEIIKDLSLEQKAALLQGWTTWTTLELKDKGIPPMFMSDGPVGLRKQAGAGDHLGLNASVPATCFPTAATMANTWDVSLGEELGRTLGTEAAANDGHSIDEVFTAENIYHINSIKDYGTLDNENMLRHHTRVFFPEYEASYDGNIGDVLKNSFNIEKMFSPEECDFSNITDETVACDGVVHKCELKVNRKGIEGAAVTYIPLCGAVGPGQYKDVYHDFIVDRAFGFIITDNYGVVLFCGVVNNV